MDLQRASLIESMKFSSAICIAQLCSLERKIDLVDVKLQFALQIFNFLYIKLVKLSFIRGEMGRSVRRARIFVIEMQEACMEANRCSGSIIPPQSALALFKIQQFNTISRNKIKMKRIDRTESMKYVRTFVHAINFPENALWIGFILWELDVYARLIKTTIKTVLQSDNKAIYGSKIINNSVATTRNSIDSDNASSIKTAAKATIVDATAVTATAFESVRVVDYLMRPSAMNLHSRTLKCTNNVLQLQ